VDRGEMINAGVLLHCRPLRYLGARVALDRDRVLALDRAVPTSTASSGPSPRSRRCAMPSQGQAQPASRTSAAGSGGLPPRAAP